MLRCWDSESIGLDFSPMKSSLFSVLASLIHTRWTEDLSCGFIKVALLFTEQHSGQQANMAYVKIWWYYFSVLGQINKVLMENYFCVVCVGQLKKNPRSHQRKHLCDSPQTTSLLETSKCDPLEMWKESFIDTRNTYQPWTAWHLANCLVNSTNK